MLKGTLKLINKYNAVLRWWFMFSALCVGVFFAYNANFLQRFINADQTYISFIIFGLFSIFTFITGRDTYKICKTGFTQGICDRTDVGWFFSDIFVTLGMTGTVFGFIMMLENFSGDLSTKIALANMSRGMGTALYTTAAGIVCSLLLKIQLFNISQYMEKCKIACENTDD